MRKQVHYYKKIPVVATYHPAYILRSPSSEVMVLEDFDLLLEVLRK